MGALEVGDGIPRPGVRHVVTVCDQAREACPVFPGAKRQLHWDFDDPAAAEGNDEERLAAFRRTLAGMRTQVDALIPIARGPGTLSRT